MTFEGERPREIWLFRRWIHFHISLMQGKWMFYSTRPTFWWNILAIFVYQIIISEHLWSYLYLHGIPLYDQIVKSWEFRIREIRYCWEGNTMLLREKYDVLINVTWDCFDQSNFYISWINIIEWNNTQWHYFLGVILLNDTIFLGVILLIDTIFLGNITQWHYFHG